MSGTCLTCPEIAKEIIASLRADNIEPTLDQIAELIELARRVQEPARKTSPWYEGTPVRAGENGPTLRPLTIQAEEWFDWAVSAFADDKLRGVAFCLASERGRMEGAFEGLWAVAPAKRAIAEYSRTLACTRAELESAAMRIMDETNPGDVIRSRNAAGDEAQGYDYGDLIAKLAAITGQPREYWLAQSRTYAFRVLQHAVNFAAQSGGLGAEKPQQDPDYLRASFDLQAAEVLIREGAKNGG